MDSRGKKPGDWKLLSICDLRERMGTERIETRGIGQNKAVSRGSPENAKPPSGSLEHAAVVTEQNSLQYVRALNSDMIPADDLSPGFDLDKHVRVRLTDKDPAGSLLGMRFG